MEGYSVKVKEANRELTAIERLKIKDASNAIKLDEALNAGPIVIAPTLWAVLDVHNEKSDNKDYEMFVVVADDGTKYVTGSASFWNSFIDIVSELTGEVDAFNISIYKVDSKNYKGKQFITCSVE